MSVLVWFRDRLFGKSKVETPVNPQITDAVTQAAPVVSAVAASTTKKPKKSSAAKAKKTK